MAKEKPRCVMCAQETEFFRRATLPLYNTNQIVCTDCRQWYERSTRQEQEELKVRMLQSPYLWDRERLETLLQWKQKEEDRRQSAASTTSPTEWMCCGGEMEELGLTQLPIVGSGMLSASVCRCRACGQIKLFDPEVK